MTRAKRRNGEGSICKVAENKWIAKISLGTGPDGKTIMKQFSGKTEAIVKKKLKEFKKSPDFTAKHLPSQETVKSYFSMWLRKYQFNIPTRNHTYITRTLQHWIIKFTIVRYNLYL